MQKRDDRKSKRYRDGMCSKLGWRTWKNEAEQRGKQMREGLFADPPEGEACQRDPKLSRGDVGVEMLDNPD